MITMNYFTREKGLAFKLIFSIFSSISIIFFLIFIYNYNVSKKIVEKNLKSNAENLTTASVLKVEKVLSAIQKIPDNFSKIIESSDFSKEELLKILQQLVANNPEIFGTTLAFEPNCFDVSQKYFSPYFYRSSGEIAFKYIGDEKYDSW